MWESLGLGKRSCLEKQKPTSTPGFPELWVHGMGVLVWVWGTGRAQVVSAYKVEWAQGMGAGVAAISLKACSTH